MPFIVLNASPNHWVSSKKKSGELKGKWKIEYVEVDMDEEGSEGRNNIPIASNGNEEMPPAVKIGPPKRTGKKIPTCTEDPVQVPDDPVLFAPLPGPSTLPLPKHAPKKRISKKTPPDEIVRPTDKPVTCSSSKPSLTKKTDEAPKIAKTDQGKKSSWKHGEKELVDKVSELFEA